VLEITFLRVEGGYQVSAETNLGAAATPFVLTDAEVGRLAVDGATFYASEDPKPAKAVRIGRRIFARVFRGEALGLFRETRGAARAQGSALRLVFRFEKASEIQEVPWELVHDGTRF